MKHEYSLLLRVILAVVPIPFFYFIFAQPTMLVSSWLTSYYNPLLIGDLFIVGGHTFVFVEACIASLAYALLWVLVWLIKDISMDKRVFMLLSSWAVLFIVNVIRIATLVSIAMEHGMDAFIATDVWVWWVISGVLIAIIWIAMVLAYDVKSIPIWDDLKALWDKSYFSRKSLP